MERDSLKWPLNKPDIPGRKGQILHGACQLHWVVFSFIKAMRISERESRYDIAIQRKKELGKVNLQLVSPKLTLCQSVEK